MLDIQYIRDHKEAIAKAAAAKHVDIDIETLLAIDRKRIQLLQELEELYSLKNDINDLIAKASPEERPAIIEKGKEIKRRTEATEPEFEAVKREFDALMAKVPTIPSEDTPSGGSDADNVEVFSHGEKPVFDFEPKNHIELGKSLDILDFERGAKVGGYRGYYLKNEGATLVMGLMLYAMQKLVSKGYQAMIPPTLVKGFALFGSGYFKGSEYDAAVDEVYQVATSDKEASGEFSRDKKFLVGTAEPSLLSYYANETLDGAKLPVKLAGFSPCYRSEIGSYGKDTKGLYRVHEFFKVEQVVLAEANIEAVSAIQDEMVDISREMHEELGLPYRKLAICTGDLGLGKYRQFDLEAWLPGMNRWGETGSASVFLDWQARRLNVRYVDQTTGEKKHVFMLNNTALPSPRILIAILENFQQKDGSVVIPEVLRPYVGKDAIVPKE